MTGQAADLQIAARDKKREEAVANKEMKKLKAMEAKYKKQVHIFGVLCQNLEKVRKHN